MPKYYHDIRLQRCKDIDTLNGYINERFKEEPGKVLSWLRGASIKRVDMSDLYMLWRIQVWPS